MMRVVIDTNVLIALLEDPSSCDYRAKGLLEQIQANKGELIIPTVVVAEYLSAAGSAGSVLLGMLEHNRHVRIAPFDMKAAVECAAMHRTAIGLGEKRRPLAAATPWQKVKVDRQIVAIAKSLNASVVTMDGDIVSIASAANVSCQRLTDLPIPISARQMLIPTLPSVSTEKVSRRVTAPKALPPPSSTG